MGFSEQTKQEVWDESGGLCQYILPDGRRCLAPGAEFHHRNPKKMGGRRGQARKDIDGKDNCMLVCLECHRRRHG